jgi:toxin-antitoxin system PIN domain toxin
VIVVDANLLLYAYNSGSPRHAKARDWWEEVLSGSEAVGLPWQSIAAFIRITTDPRLPGKHFAAEEAAQIVDSWLQQTIVGALTPGDEHWFRFRSMVVEGQALGALVTHAQIAALTVEYGGVLHTTDRDFARFPGLRWKNPLV